MVQSTEKIIFDGSIHEIRNIGSQYMEMTVITKAPYAHLAGQHTILTLSKNGQSIQNYYSIASAPNTEQKIDFCLQIDQNPETSAVLHSLEVGDPVQLSPPRGQFLLPRERASQYIFIAGGSGIAPLRAQLQSLINNEAQEKLILIYGCKSGLAVPYERELAALSATQKNFKVHFIVEEQARSSQQTGLVTDVLNQYLCDESQYLLCGPRGMIDSVECLLEKADIPQNHVFHEGRTASNN